MVAAYNRKQHPLALASGGIVRAFQPNESYRFSFKEGFTGWDVEAVQIALNGAGISADLAEDGSFGPKTKAAAVLLQQVLRITADGVIGPQTQQALCAREAGRVEKGITPAGLLKGICFGESGGFWAATGPAYPDGSRDYGPWQDNLGMDASELAVKEAFIVGRQAREVGVARKSAHDFFAGQPGAQTPEEAWRLAVLNYNWPAAANVIAQGQAAAAAWVYTEAGTGARRHLRDQAPWVEQFKIPGVTTGYDWARFYVDTKVVYVSSWSVS